MAARYDYDFLLDLQDEGFLPGDIDVRHLVGNESLIGEANLKLHGERLNYRCSVNQSRMAGWFWLIGSPDGTLKPLLCMARRRDTCEAFHFSGDFHMTFLAVVLGIGCLLAFFNLLTLAVWSRCKSLGGETAIQLLILRVLCLVDTIGLLSMWGLYIWPRLGRLRVFSIAHAVLATPIVSLGLILYPLCLVLNSGLGLATCVYLVEHSHPAQYVLLFTNKRRAQIILGAILLLTLVGFLPIFLDRGAVYCVSADNGNAYLLGHVYNRLSSKLEQIVYLTKGAVFGVFSLVSAILTIVYASKRCCACCRGSPAPLTSGAATAATAAPAVSYVAYARQIDDEQPAAEDSEPGVVLLDVAPSQSSQASVLELSDELRRLLFWHQASYAIILVLCLLIMLLMTFTLIFSSRNIPMTLIFFVYGSVTLLLYIGMFARLAVLSSILCPTFRQHVCLLVDQLRASIVQYRGGFHRLN